MFESILRFIFGFAKYVIVFIALIVILSYFILKNVVAFPVMQHFGTDQYLQNIIHFHGDSYGMLKRKVELYDKITKIQDRDSSINHLVLQPGNIFRYKGYIEKEDVKWIAAIIYKEHKPVYGYFVIPKNLNYENNNEYYYLNWNGFYIWSDVKEERDGKYFRAIKSSNMKITKATGGLKMQEIRESNKYLVLWASTDNLYYCDKSYTPLVNTISDKYYRKNEEEVFLDISNRWH